MNCVNFPDCPQEEGTLTVLFTHFGKRYALLALPEGNAFEPDRWSYYALRELEKPEGFHLFVDGQPWERLEDENGFSGSSRAEEAVRVANFNRKEPSDETC